MTTITSSAIAASVLALLGVGGVYVSTSRSGEAAKQAPSLAVQREQREFSDAVSRGRAALDSNHPAAAALIFESALATRPRSPDGHRWLALAYEKQGKSREAISEYRAAIDDPKALPSSYQSDPQVLTSYADLCVKAGDLSRARNLYARATLPPATLPSEMPKREKERNALMFKSKRPQEGELVAMRSLPLEKLRANALSAVAKQDLLTGRPAQAVESLRQAVQLDGANWETHRDLALALFRSGRTEEAKQEFRVAARSAKGKDLLSVRTSISELGLGDQTAVLRFGPDGTSSVTYKEAPSEVSADLRR